MVIWVKTILNVYRYLERVSGAIDRIVMSRATNSFYTSSGNLSFNSVLKVSEDIMTLTERKVRLINLKLITENALEAISPSLAKILVFVFIEKRTCYECADLLGVSLRTYFRRLKTALDSFEKALTRKGYNKAFFDKMLSGEHWILEVKEKMLSKEDCFEMNHKFASKICMDYKTGRISPQIHSSLTL